MFVLIENFCLQAVHKNENLNVNSKLRIMLTASVVIESRVDNRPFASCFEPHYEGGAFVHGFIMKISFH